LSNTIHDDHDNGLKFDLKTIMARRKLFGLLGVAGASVLVSGCGFGGEDNVSGVGANGAACVKDPAETAGPYPGDGTNSKAGQTVNVLTQSGIVREDMRSSFGGMTPTAEGVQLDMNLTLVNVSNACAPLAGHAVYVWHCDIEGKYSLYDLPEANYLRAVGITDAKGAVSFTTIFPGCYDGRWPHIHFEVFSSPEKAVNGDDSLLISQFAFPEASVKAFYGANPAYASAAKNLTKTTLKTDMVFADNTPEQIAMQTLVIEGDSASGITGRALISVETA
jgi:protocatechuate 3,4-dioxygenase beta subunit